MFLCFMQGGPHQGVGDHIGCPNSPWESFRYIIYSAFAISVVFRSVVFSS